MLSLTLTVEDTTGFRADQNLRLTWILYASVQSHPILVYLTDFTVSVSPADGRLEYNTILAAVLE